MMVDIEYYDSKSPNSPNSYKSRIIKSTKEKKSPIILALDFNSEYFDNNNKKMFKKCKEIISSTESKICAIKVNFHLLLSLTNIQIVELNFFAHKFNLQSIADLKLNDIGNTNMITINRLQKLGFDAVIVNPFIGITEMKSLTGYAHSINFGVISLVYMSHPSSFEGYGLEVSIPSSFGSSSCGSQTSSSSLPTHSRFALQTTDKIEKKHVNSFKRDIISMYRLLYNYAYSSGSDGIVIGGTKDNIIKEISQLNHNVSIYSPGLITQGGSLDIAITAGTDYFIIGRYIINSSSPVETLNSLLEEIRKYKKFKYDL
ncbi:MAG: orotidine 5'-phosphate decarboxylase / HUMPS family protein [Nitrososphaeraceae archaeon]